MKRTLRLTVLTLSWVVAIASLLATQNRTEVGTFSRPSVQLLADGEPPPPFPPGGSV